MKKKLLVFAALLILALACASVASATDVPVGAHVTRGELDEITSIAGHIITSYEIALNETCTEEGRAVFSCELPDDTNFYWVFIKPHGHTMSSETNPYDWGRVVTPATCTEEGLAIDVCVCEYVYCPCHWEDENHTRVIDKIPHEYDDDHYVEYKAPRCDATGLGQHVCVHCGEPKPKEKEADMVVLDKIPHSWTDWNVYYDSNCAEYGKIGRTCTRCSYLQYLDNNIQTVTDQGETVFIGDILPLKNEGWVDLDGNVYNEQNLLDKDLEGFETKIRKNWLVDCYTREITYYCPYCNGTVHPDFTVTLEKPATIAHVFEVAPDGDDDGEHSVAPTCTDKGFYLYLCKFDKVGIAHGHDLSVKDDRWYKEERPALDHAWGDWYPADLFMKDGEWYLVSFRSCSRCGAYEQKTEEYEKPEVKQGLVHDDDGVWRYYINGEVATNVTKLVPFQGGEFWVTNGVVPPEANGMTVCPDGKAYFLAQGQVQRVTQWALYDGEWFILKNGELDKVTGLQPYDGGWFAVESGRKLHVNGLWQDPNSGVWTYMADGQLQDYTGETTYDGATFNVVHGYLVD